MKRLTIIIGLILIMGSPFKVLSQKYRNKEISLIQLNVTIQPEIKRHLELLEGSFPDLKNEKADKIIGKIKEQVWGVLQDKLQSDIGMTIMPLNTFGDDIAYDLYGFPDASVSKAQKKGASKYYMKVDVNIGNELFQYTTQITTKNKKDSVIHNTPLQEGEFKPVVTITLTTYPASGILQLNKFIGGAKAPKAWTVKESILDGLVNDNNKNDLSSLMSLIQESINDLTLSILTD